MSGSGGYDWSYERERERQRVAVLRADLAAQRHRADVLTALAKHARKAGIGGAVTVPRVVQSAGPAGSAELERQLTSTRAALDAAEGALTAAWDQQYRTLAGQSTTVNIAEPARRSAREELGRSDRHPHAATANVTASIAELHRRAGLLVESVLFRCGQEDRKLLQDRCSALRDAPTTSQAHAALVDLQVRAQRAIERQTVIRRREESLARLLSLADEAGHDERMTLRRWIATVPDPSAPEVHRAVIAVVERESRRRARTAVATTTAAALAELGYDVGESFVTVLDGSAPLRPAGDAAAIVLITPHSADHGLRLYFDPSKDRFYTTVVRRTEASPATQEHDTEVQRKVCRDINAVTGRLESDKCQVTVFRQVAPGDRPPPTVDAASWPTTAAGATTATAHQQVEQRQVRVAERQVDRRSAG